VNIECNRRQYVHRKIRLYICVDKKGNSRHITNQNFIGLASSNKGSKILQLSSLISKFNSRQCVHRKIRLYTCVDKNKNSQHNTNQNFIAQTTQGIKKSSKQLSSLINSKFNINKNCSENLFAKTMNLKSLKGFLRSKLARELYFCFLYLIVMCFYTNI
jgi:hypothetical protein